MAETTAATGLTVQQWDDKFFKESLNANIFKPFMGTKENNVIQVKENLTKAKGDSITFALLNKLSQAATTGDATLEGAEESVSSRSQKVVVNLERHAVLVSELQNQFSAIDLRNGGKSLLLDWEVELTRDKIIKALGSINGVAYASATEAQKDAWLVDNADRVLFGALKSNGSSNDHSTSLATIDNTDDKLTPGAISLMKRIAKTATPKVRPLKPREGGVTSDSYVLFVPSLLLRDLTNNSTFLQANREARQRGSDNPIFKGADYIYDNVAIIEVEDITPVSNGTINVAPCFLCGAQAIGIAWAARPESREDEKDYGEKHGCAIRQIYGVEKLRFGSGAGDTDDLQDHGVVTGWFAAVADS